VHVYSPCFCVCTDELSETPVLGALVHAPLTRLLFRVTLCMLVNIRDCLLFTLQNRMNGSFRSSSWHLFFSDVRRHLCLAVLTVWVCCVSARNHRLGAAAALVVGKVLPRRIHESSAVSTASRVATPACACTTIPSAHRLQQLAATELIEDSGRLKDI
jgi:hypothetical protein